MLKFLNSLLKIVYAIRKRYQGYKNNFREYNNGEIKDISFNNWLLQLSDRLNEYNCSSLMLHCKFSSIHARNRDPEALISFLKRWVHGRGILIFPAFELETSQEKFLELNSKVTLTSEKINTGIFAKLASEDGEFYRTLHPTHSMLVYPFEVKSEFINHGADGTFSMEGSPIKSLEESDGWVLNIGVGLNSTTSIHLAEERNQKSFPITTLSKSNFDGIITNKEERKTYSVRPISKSLVSVRDCNWLKPFLVDSGALVEFDINGTNLQLINLRRMSEIVEECALQGTTIYGKYFS